MISTDVTVEVSGRPDLSHKRSSVKIVGPTLVINRMADQGRPDQISSSGAHFTLTFPGNLAIHCFERPVSRYYFKGPNIGSMKEVWGAPARDGTYAHGVHEFSLTLEVNLAEDHFGISIAGKLSQIRQSIDGWPQPRPLSHFSIVSRFPLQDAELLFYNQPYVKEPLARYLARLRDT